LRERIWHWGKIWSGGCGDFNSGAVLDDLIDTEKRTPLRIPLLRKILLAADYFRKASFEKSYNS
jgi:hypothetical protein